MHIMNWDANAREPFISFTWRRFCAPRYALEVWYDFLFFYEVWFVMIDYLQRCF